MTSRTNTISYDQRARLFWVLVTISIMSLAIYFYAIHATARHIAQRQGLERQMAQVSTGLDALEFAYIELKNNITIEVAYQYGFREVKNPLYVSRVRPASLSFNTLER
jgi:hypothetical protein